MTDTMTIHGERQSIMRERGKKVAEMLKEYDETVYRPALSALKERCAAAGHGRLRLWDNGVGWAWNECPDCGSRVGEPWQS
jgi:hypothetical protein